jgi:hypothetical protein
MNKMVSDDEECEGQDIHWPGHCWYVVDVVEGEEGMMELRKKDGLPDEIT